jgi:DNA-binding CsgD family transcriptional regulator
MEHVVRAVRRACASGLDSVTLRREIVGRIAPVVAFDAYAFSTCDPDTGLMSHTVAHNVPRSLGQIYAEYLYPREAAIMSMDMPRRGAPMFSMPDMSRDIRQAFRVAGLDDQIHMSLESGGRLLGTWCLMRSAGSSAESARSRELIRSILPYVTRGLEAATLVDLARSPAIETNDAAPGIVVLDARGHVSVRTSLATRWLADLADEGIGTSSELPLCVLGLAARVRALRSDIPQEPLVRVRGASGQCYVLRASLSEPDARGESAVVLVVRPALRGEIAPILTRLYALSAREREIVAAVARGEATKQIAATLRISPHTVEEHLGRACMKIGVRGRKALVAKLFVDGYLGAVKTSMASSAAHRPNIDPAAAVV